VLVRNIYTQRIKNIVNNIFRYIATSMSPRRNVGQVACFHHTGYICLDKILVEPQMGNCFQTKAINKGPKWLCILFVLK